MKVLSTIFFVAGMTVLVTAEYNKIEPSPSDLPAITLYEDHHRGGSHFFMADLVKGRCYTNEDLGLMNNRVSDIDNHKTCVDFFNGNNCDDLLIRFDDSVTDACEENLELCPKNINDQVSSFKLC